MGDPLKLFQSRDIAAAALYAKQVASDLADLYPVLVDADGNLRVNITAGTVSLSNTAVTINNAVSNPVNVSLTSTAVTVSGSVSLTNTAVTAALSTTRVTATLISGQTAIAADVGAVGATTPRVVQANDAGKSLSSSSGTTTLTNTTILIAGSAKNKVYAFSLTTTSTTGVICAFQAGSGGTELWRVLLQAPSGANAGANLSVAPPAYLFASASNGTLNLNLSTSVRVDFSVSYFNEA